MLAKGESQPDEQTPDEWTVNFVIEAKALYAHERNRISQLIELRKQLLRARRHGSSAIGMLYLIDFKRARSRKGVSVRKPFYDALEEEIVRTFHGTQYTWLRRPTFLRRMRMAYTTFPEFPSMVVSIGTAALELK